MDNIGKEGITVEAHRFLDLLESAQNNADTAIQHLSEQSEATQEATRRFTYYFIVGVLVGAVFTMALITAVGR